MNVTKLELVNGRLDEEREMLSTKSGLARLILWKRDLAWMLGVKLRTLERMISTGEIPPPNRRLRGRPAWLIGTIYEWANGGCPVIGANPLATGSSCCYTSSDEATMGRSEQARGVSRGKPAARGPSPQESPSETKAGSQGKGNQAVGPGEGVPSQGP